MYIIYHLYVYRHNTPQTHTHFIYTLFVYVDYVMIFFLILQNHATLFTPHSPNHTKQLYN